MGDCEPLAPPASDDGEVRDLRRSLMKSFTTLREDRREWSSLSRLFDSDRRPSLDIRRSRMVSLECSSAAGVHTGEAFWWSTKRGDSLSSTGLNSDGSFGGSSDFAAFWLGSRTILAVTEIDSGEPPFSCACDSNLDKRLATEFERSL